MHITHFCVDSDLAFDAESSLVPCPMVVRGGGDGGTGVGERTRSGSIFSGNASVDDPDATGAVGGVVEMEAAAETFEIELEVVGAALAGATAMGTTGVILSDVEVSAGEVDVGLTAAAALCLDVATGTSSGALSIIRAVSASLEAELTDRVTE